MKRSPSPERLPNPDCGGMSVFVFALAVVVVVVCVGLLLLLDVYGDAPVGQMFMGMVR